MICESRVMDPRGEARGLCPLYSLLSTLYSLLSLVPVAPLPIDAVLSQVIEELRANACAVLRAPTGSGKTTRVAPAILDAGLAGEGAIVMLEPRRVAARAAARRI